MSDPAKVALRSQEFYDALNVKFHLSAVRCSLSLSLMYTDSLDNSQEAQSFDAKTDTVTLTSGTTLKYDQVRRSLSLLRPNTNHTLS